MTRNRAFDDPGGHTATLHVTDGTTTVSASAPFGITSGPSETFDIEIDPVTTLTVPQRTAFDTAAALWEQAIVRGIPDVAVDIPADACEKDGGWPAINRTVDDLVIQAQIVPIDGPGGVLGEAGPCAVYNVDHFTRVGTMKFDSADVATMIGDGSFTEVVTHEMGHVLGFGTLWDDGRSLITGAGGSDPRFVGPRAEGEYQVLGGTGSVPVENTGGAGTADSHWRESVFGDELMTGFIDDGPNPLSAMSIASMADLGYQVSLSAAQPYTLPGGGLFRQQSGPTPDRGVMLRPTPIHIG
jgi:hypothetical protein